MSIFKSFFTNKSIDLPLDTRISGLSKDSVETNQKGRRLSSVNLEEIPSNRTKTLKEENRYLHMHVQDLNSK